MALNIMGNIMLPVSEHMVLWKEKTSPQEAQHKVKTKRREQLLTAFFCLALDSLPFGSYNAHGEFEKKEG